MTCLLGRPPDPPRQRVVGLSLGASDSARYLRYYDEIEDETFHIPVPPPFSPPPGDVLFVRGAPEGGPRREHEDIMLRSVPRETAALFRAGAGGRGLTHAQFLSALVELHRRLRERADAGDENARKLLDELELASVTV